MALTDFTIKWDYGTLWLRKSNGVFLDTGAPMMLAKTLLGTLMAGVSSKVARGLIKEVLDG